MATDILSSAIDNAITTSNSWLTRNTLPFMATILRNADDSIPADVKFDDSCITEVAYRSFEKYKAYCNYTYQDWYLGMYDWLADRILMETRTPLAVSLTKTQIETDMPQAKGTSKIIFIIAAIAILLLLLPERENTQRLSDLRKRRSRRLFFISNGKVIPRSEVDTTKRMARAGYGKVHAVWAYNADEAREFIRQGKAETISGIELHGMNSQKASDSLPPILGWVGGKTKLADKIIAMMPEHKVYVEPFLGGGSVFFKKPLADVNVINDLDKDLMNFYKGVRDGSCEKIRGCKLPKNRKEFDKAVDNRGKDICSYLGVNKRNYGSQYIGRNNSFFHRKGNNGILRFQDSCDKHKDKLKQTKVLNKDFKDVIKKFDSKDTLAYIDPPYVDVTLYKHNNINPEDIAKLVKTMKGKAIVSYNNHPRVRKAFAGLNFHKVKNRYELQKSMTGIPKDVSELIITNF